MDMVTALRRLTLLAVVAVLLTGCIGGSASAATGPLAVGTAISSLFRQIRPDGIVRPALRVFSVVLEPLPSMTPPFDPSPEPLPPLPAAGPYLAVAENAATEIASHLGRSLGVPIGVVVNATQIGDPTDGAYATPYDSGGGGSGAEARCQININPYLYTTMDVAQTKNTITHEVFHCFEARDFSNLPALAAVPKWLVEGEAEWVAETLAPAENGFWDKYLTEIDVNLFTRSYDALGFYAHMQESGIDTWHRLDAMLKAGGSAGAYKVAVNTQFLNSWASSLARHAAFGAPWNATGPAIPDGVSYHPTVSVLAVGGKPLTGTVKPYTNALVEFNTSADVVRVEVSNRYGRLHDSGSADYQLFDIPTDQFFCINNCRKCPKMAAMPKLAPGAAWLAITGDSTGATYTVTAMKDMCGPCLVGDWITTKVEIQSSTATLLSGGAGEQVRIAPDGSTQLILTGSQGFTIQRLGTVQLTGIETLRLSFPADPTATSGPLLIFDVNDSGVTTTVYIAGHAAPGKGGGKGGAGTPYVNGSYSCTATGLTLSFSSKDVTSTSTLVSKP